LEGRALPAAAGEGKEKKKEGSRKKKKNTKREEKRKKKRNVSPYAILIFDFLWGKKGGVLRRGNYKRNPTPPPLLKKGEKKRKRGKGLKPRKKGREEQKENLSIYSEN